MTTLILPPRYSEDSNTLWRTAIGLGWNIERLQSWRVPDNARPMLPVAIYGESLWANFAAEQLGLRLYEPPLDWLTTLSHEFTGRDIEFCTLAESRKKALPAFIKPAGEKTFTARVYENADELPSVNIDLEAEPVIVSQIVEWDVEYRCFVLDGQIETTSSYWRGENSTRGEDGNYESPPEELKAACEFAMSVLQSEEGQIFGNRGVVLDVGIIRGFGWAVVEANPAWGAGIYGCDPEKVLNVIAHCVDQKR